VEFELINCANNIEVQLRFVNDGLPPVLVIVSRTINLLNKKLSSSYLLNNGQALFTYKGVIRFWVCANMTNDSRRSRPFFIWFALAKLIGSLTLAMINVAQVTNQTHFVDECHGFIYL